MGIRTRVGTLTRTRTRTRLGSYFDSKVLSRQHAEIWEETGKIFIKDVKSSNGTFINSERLSLEGMESDPWELKSDDIVEFGIDIVGDDNKILHYKVASRVFCLFNEQDLQIAHRSEQHQHQQRHQQQQQRSTTAYPVGPAAIAGMGGMGEGMRAPGKSVLTFEHILNRLQGELQKSRETGTELQSLNGTMSKVHDTLGGSLLRQFIDFNRHPAQSEQSDHDDDDGARSVVTVVPHELATVAEEDEEQEKEAEAGQNRQGETSRPREEKVRDVEEEAEDAERRQRQEELGRPRTPEPASLGMGSDLFTDAKHTHQYAPSAELLDALNSRLLLLWNQFESFMTLTTSLHAQHDAAQSTILNLQAKVVELEDKVKTSQSGHDDILSVSISAASAVVSLRVRTQGRDVCRGLQQDRGNGGAESRVVLHVDLFVGDVDVDGTSYEGGSQAEQVDSGGYRHCVGVYENEQPIGKSTHIAILTSTILRTGYVRDDVGSCRRSRGWDPSVTTSMVVAG
ncbi:hypothetical protein EYR40_001631 [Pleurotus pulmonarius]|nr:hypothetical protein EYR36_000006 [Pleurotus pulmonarius]KAF4609277.1 hypothetical protein EYR40_001631 [Pleurotus pulmonarius]